MIARLARIAADIQRRDFLKTLPALTTAPGLAKMGLPEAGENPLVSMSGFLRDHIRGSIHSGSNWLGSLIGIEKNAMLQRAMDYMSQQETLPDTVGVATRGPLEYMYFGMENALMEGVRKVVGEAGLKEAELTEGQWKALILRDLDNVKREAWGSLKFWNKAAYFGLKGKIKDYLKSQKKVQEVNETKATKAREEKAQMQRSRPQEVEERTPYSRTFGPFDWDQGDQSRWSSRVKAVDMKRRDFLKLIPSATSIPGLIKFSEMGFPAEATNAAIGLKDFLRTYVSGTMGTERNWLGDMVGISIPEGSKFEKFLKMSERMFQKSPQLSPSIPGIVGIRGFPTEQARDGMEAALMTAMKTVAGEAGVQDQQFTPDEWQALAMNSMSRLKREAWAGLRQYAPQAYMGLKGQVREYVKQRIKQQRSPGQKTQKTEKTEQQTKRNPSQPQKSEERIPYSETFGPFDWEHGDQSRWSSRLSRISAGIQALFVGGL